MGKNEGSLRTVSLQDVEDWINEQEDVGEMLNELGIITDEEKAAGIHKLEDFRVKIESNAEAADEAEAALENGEAPITV